MAAVLLGAVPKPGPLLVYSAPAGDRPAGADAVHPTDGILPDGRIVAPAGKSVFVGTNPLGFALSPDGRFAIVSNDDQRTGGLSIPNSEPPLVIGYSLTVVDTESMAVTSVYHNPSLTFFMGVAAVRNPSDPSSTLVFASDGANGAVRVFDLDAAGNLTLEQQSIALAPTGTRHAFPAGIAASADGRTIYVVDNVGDSLSAIDVASRRLVRTVNVGDAPLDVAAGGASVLVANGGIATYQTLPRPAHAPQFAAAPFDPDRSSTLSVFAAAPGGDFAIDPQTVRMDPAPDGTTEIGGAAPGSIVVSPNGRLAYVALANVDRVAVVALGAGEPQVIRGLDLRLYPEAPYGAQPSAQALSADGRRLYVALAGLNAVAILDAKTPKRYRYGLIPTGWYPTALALSAKDRYLYILSSKGIDGFGLLQKIDLKHPDLVRWTLDTLRFNRTASAAKMNLAIPPLRSGRRSDVIDHVVYIGFGSQGYDALFGDLRDPTGAAHGNGEPTLEVYPESVTPNLHALARTYALADNFYAQDANLDVARQFLMSGQASLYTQLLANVSVARTPVAGHGEDPDDYARSGTLFNAFSRAGMGFRDYGGMLDLTGYADGAYGIDVPALAALVGNVDLNYTTDARTDAAHRAQEFIHDIGRYVDADQMPSFTYVSLPATSRQDGLAQADRALGSIVAYLSRTPHWSSTAIFIVPEGVEQSSDHVNALRSYSIVVSPLARRGYVGHAHLSQASVVKTSEEIFGLEPLALPDLLATDMADFFVDVPEPEAYDAIR